MHTSKHIRLTIGALLATGTAVLGNQVVIGNYDAGIGTGTVFGTSATTIYKTVGWTMGTEDYTLTDITLSLNFGLAGTGIFSIWSGANMPMVRLFDLDAPPQVGAGDFVFTPPSTFVMEAGATYWLYVESIPNPTGQFRWDGTSPSTQPTGVASSAGYIFNGSPSNFLNRFVVHGSTGGPACYANCDESTTQPILNVDDFTCFINSFAAAQALTHEEQVVHYANCDGSTTAPVLNVDDFTCFINAFAQGCP